MFVDPLFYLFDHGQWECGPALEVFVRAGLALIGEGGKELVQQITVGPMAFDLPSLYLLIRSKDFEYFTACGIIFHAYFS